MKSNFSTATKNFVAKAVASSSKQYGNIVRLSVIGAFAMGAIFTFGTQPANPGHATVADVAVVLLAKETGTGSALGTGTGAQILAGVMEDSTLWSASGGLIVGDLASPVFQIVSSGATVIAPDNPNGIGLEVKAAFSGAILFGYGGAFEVDDGVAAMRGTLSGSTIVMDSWGAAPAGSVPCKKADNSLGWRGVSATGTLLPTCN